MAIREGQLFGNYRLLRLLGQGGFAGVYLGEHVYLQTQAAIKILHTRLAQSEYKAFLQEARIVAHLEHPHIIPVLDFGLQDGTPYLVMRYAPNGSLRFVPGTRMPPAVMISYVKDSAAALSYAHDQGIVHSDIKPENMLLGKQRELLIGDFGVAAITRTLQPLTQQETGGTVWYMAPEQIEGSVCPASDQYALAVVVYEWLCGARPFTGTPEEVIEQRLNTAPPSLCERDAAISSQVEEVVMKALMKKPEQRFTGVLEFAAALEQAVLSGDQATHTRQAISVQPGRDGAALIPQLWSVPYRRNPLFTGRAGILQRVHDLWSTDNAASLCALTGLGGMGKTQTAIEYAYRYRADYRAIVWVRAETVEALQVDLAALASALGLEQEGHNQQRDSEAVRKWLETNERWLLILDNVEELPLIEPFIPLEGKGHILITSRSPVTGATAVGIELERMTPEEGALFLLRRSRLVEYNAVLAEALAADVVEAEDIVRFMDGLPLALDQAGAYIEETGCCLYDYINLYRQRPLTLLQRRGSTAHPEPVSATWLLSFERIEQAEAAVASVMKLCAFLDPDGMPEEMLFESEDGLDEAEIESYRLDAAIAALRRFALVRRLPAHKMLVMHRLVQAVLRDRMAPEEQRLWAERAVQAVNRVFPDGDQVAAWPRCQRYISSVWVCATHMERWRIVSPEAARLLDQAGLYLLEQAQYHQARVLLQRALAMREELLGPEHLDVAHSLENLAGPYLYQGQYAMAEPLFERVLAIRISILGENNPDVAVSLNNLGLLYQYQGNYARAAELYRQSLDIWERIGTVDHPHVARTTGNLAWLYHSLEQVSLAEQLYLEAIAIWERVGGSHHPDLAVCLNNLAQLYHRLGRFSQAETLFQRVLDIRERTLEPDHPSIAQSLQYLAQVQQSRWLFREAELLFKHALAIRKKSQGPAHLDVAMCLGELARFYAFTERCELAEQVYQQALSVCEQASGAEHPYRAILLKRYAALLSHVGRKREAVELNALARTIHRKSFQPDLNYEQDPPPM